MKLILAIVNHDDASKVLKGLTQNGYSVTKLATTGGFLMAGNTTLIIGVEEDKVDGALEIIANFSKRRTQFVPPIAGSAESALVSMPIEVTVGGATVFIIDVERFEKF